MEGYFDDNKAWIIPTAVGATSLVAGFFAGIFYARHSVRRIVVVQEATVYEEVEEQEEEVDRNQLKIDYDNAVTDYNQESIVEENDQVEMAHSDNFDIEPASIIELTVENPADGTSHKHRATMGTWNYERELERRSPDEPYVIHMDEFLENES